MTHSSISTRRALCTCFTSRWRNLTSPQRLTRSHCSGTKVYNLEPMKFPYSMLRDFVNTNLDAEQIGDLLTMAGFELEGIEEVEGQPVLDIKVVSNRGDGLSVFGLSREVLAKDARSTPTALYLQAAHRFRE